MKVFLKARGWEKIKTYMSVPLYQSSIILPSVYKVLSLMCMCTYLCSYTSLCMHSCGCKHVNGSAFEGQSQRLVSFHRNYVPCFKTGALNSIEFAKMLRVAGKGTPGIFLSLLPQIWNYKEMVTTHSFLHVLEVRLRSSWLFGRYCTNCNNFLAL